MNIGMWHRQGHYGSAYMAENNIPYKGFRRSGIIGGIIRRSAEANTYGACYIAHNDIGKSKVLDSGPACADLDGASIGFIDQAIRNGDILWLTSAKAEDRPSRAETAIGDGHKFVAAKQCTSIILALDVTIDDVDILATAEMKPIIIFVDPVVYSDPIYMYLLAL